MTATMTLPRPTTLAARLDASAPVEGRWTAVTERDASQDGRFVYAVSTTGVYCRPSCPSRRPRREHVAFFAPSASSDMAPPRK